MTLCSAEILVHGEATFDEFTLPLHTAAMIS